MSGHPKDRLSAYLDGELSSADREAVDVHLRECPACTTELQQLAVVDALARDATDEVPAGYFETLPARIGPQLRASPRPAAAPAPTPIRRPWAMPSWAYAAAAMLLMAVVAPYVAREAKPPVSAKASAFPSPPLSDRPAPEAAAAAPSSAPVASVPAAPKERPRAEPAPERRNLARSVDATDELKAKAEGDVTSIAESAAAPAAVPTTEPDREQANAFADEPAPAPATAAPEERRAREAAPSVRAAQSQALPPAGLLRKAVPHALSKERYAALEARVATTLVELRTLRDDYRAFITENGGSSTLGEAWIRVVELDVRLATASQDAADWDRARNDAAMARSYWRKDPVKDARLLELLSKAPEKR